MSNAEDEMSTKHYMLTFMTHNFHTGGTKDSKVFVCLFGGKGDTGMVHVKCPDLEPNKIFEKANKQTFHLEAEDVGEVTKVSIVHDNKEGVFKWHLDWVRVKADGQSTKFLADKWLEQEASGTMLKINLSADTGGPVKADNKGTDTEHSKTEQTVNEVSNTEAEKSVVKRAEEIARSADFIVKKEKSKAYLESVGIVDEYFEERMEELAKDMAERELERTQEFMQFERAGLSEEKRKLIPKLDETNNLCYKYLRDHGNNWQYDPNAVDPRMKSRLYRRFDTFDKDSDGRMTLDEVLSWADRMKSLCETNDEEVETVRNALRSYFSNYGLNEDGLHRENWVEAHITMKETAQERMRQGDASLMEMLADAYFDVIDENDDGKISLPELKKMMNVFRVPEEAAYPFFEKADIDLDGSLARTEMHNLFYRFWFGEYDSDLDGIFAYKY